MTWENWRSGPETRWGSVRLRRPPPVVTSPLKGQTPVVPYPPRRERQPYSHYPGRSTPDDSSLHLVPQAALAQDVVVVLGEPVGFVPDELQQPERRGRAAQPDRLG